MLDRHKQKERRTSIDEGKVFCQVNNRILEYIIINDNGDDYTLEGHFEGNWFNIKKDKCFETRDDLKYNNFKVWCFNLLKGKKGNGSKYDGALTKELAKTHLLKYLSQTKQTVYKERFEMECSEYLI